MNSKKIAVLSTLALTLVVGMTMFRQDTTKAAVAGCTVPTDHATIQAAVNDVGCSVINVMPGMYNENVVIPRSLSLNGAQVGIDARGRSGAESIINGGVAANITITANGVTVDGFTLNGPSSSGTAAIVMQTGNTGETVQNNIISNPGRAASITTSNTTFSKNAVNNTATASDGFQANSTPVSNLTISDNSFGGANSAIYNADITIIEGNSNVVVSGNSSNADGTLVALFKTNGAQITGNTVVGTANSSAIYVGGGDSNVFVNGNQVSSAAPAVKVANAFGVGPNSSVTITGNTLYNNAYGVNVAATSVTDTVQAHRNSLTGNTAFGISNDPTSGGLVSGTCNWWGAASGPGPIASGSGDKVSTGVIYAPWLVSANLNGPCIGGNVATNKDQCKNDGWKTLVRANNTPFKNQGDCVSYTNNGK
ncbi:MAG TPA: hypothetical protein VK582_02655 [Pyrinomonadaceae bacterium]|nr:hypothetical protein [Pyrinomonadaceae bacterium]